MMSYKVLRLKAMIRDQAAGMFNQRQVCGAGYMEVSGEETVESTSTDIHRPQPDNPAGVSHQITGNQSGNFLSAPKEYNTISAPFWGIVPPYNPQQTSL